MSKELQEIKVSYIVDKPSGVTSQSSVNWNDNKLKTALRSLFGCTADEQIASLIVTNNGITAIFK